MALGTVRPELDLPQQSRPRGSSRRARAADSGAAEPEPGADPELLARLKAWRTEEARRRSLPPYVIFHDRTLAAVAAVRPRGIEELGRIKGIGPAKLAAYGEALLQLLA